ncbi:MAG: tetratricopeptide repeat protein [Geothrix sp.]|nr:tetratricopeptide repeat protein [Geothrix sp.]
MTSNAKKELEAAAELHRSGRKTEALSAYVRYLKVRPGDARGWTALGGLHLGMGQLEASREASSRALRLDRNQWAAHVNLANALSGLGLFEASEGACRLVLAKHAQNLEAKLALARCLCLKGDLAQARSWLEALAREDPSNRRALGLLVEVLVQLGQWEAYETAMGRLISLHAHPPAIETYDRGLLDLRLGNLPRGWARYESRLECPGLIVPKRDFSQPRWKGGPFEGKTLLVHFEQGLGDTFMFLRYVTRVKALGGRVLLEVQPALADVAATCPGADEVVPYGSPLPTFDLHISLLSLPWVFGTDLQSIPAEVPYLSVPERVPNRDRITELLAASEGSIRVGLAWAGSPGHKRDSERSLPPALLAPLTALPGVSWYSFQLGATEEPPLPGLVSLDPSIRNFSDTAYALTSMQLVITVDTALAHLAGAMGIPTLLLVAFLPDFRWMMGREDSPWYPTMRIYRQPVPGAWGAVLRQVVGDLAAGQDGL